jgi:hypothetical protein
MQKETKVIIYDIVGNGHCTASEDGQKVFLSIKSKLLQGERVVLSFYKVEDLTTAFLNAAVGQLYSEFNETEIKEKLTVEDAKSENLTLLKRVVDRAKEFFEKPERFKEAAEGMLGDGDDS